MYAAKLLQSVPFFQISQTKPYLHFSQFPTCDVSRPSLASLVLITLKIFDMYQLKS